MVLIGTTNVIEREPLLGEVSGGEIVLLIVGGLLTILLVILFITIIVRAHRQEGRSSSGE